MTSIWQWTRVCAIALLVVAYSPAASAQATGEADPHKEHHGQAAQPSGGDQATKPMSPDMMGMKDMMARMSALDARIDTLVADMNMFGGELRISAMVSLLSALAERNKVMRDTMMTMHEEMMGRVTAATAPAPSDDDEAGMMCSMMKHKAAEPQP
jgi:hypothetical protein